MEHSLAHPITPEANYCLERAAHYRQVALDATDPALADKYARKAATWLMCAKFNNGECGEE